MSTLRITTALIQSINEQHSLLSSLSLSLPLFGLSLSILHILLLLAGYGTQVEVKFVCDFNDFFSRVAADVRGGRGAGRV